MSKRVLFKIPDIKTDKPLAKSTFANYKVYLNQLAGLGFKDIDDLISQADPEMVRQIVKETKEDMRRSKEEAVEEICYGVQKYFSGLNDKKKPLCNFLFAEVPRLHGVEAFVVKSSIAIVLFFIVRIQC